MKYRLYEFVSFLLNLPKNYFMRIIFLFCFFFASFVSLSQSYKISGSVSGLNNDSVILAYYFGGKQYAVDTAASNEGKFVFQGKKQLGGGMYMVVLPDQKYFDIIISEQVFSFSTNLNSLIEDMQFKNSKENPPLYEYLNFISQKQKEVSILREKENSSNNDQEKQTITKQIQSIDQEVKDYQKLFEEKYSDRFFTKIVKATKEPIIPDPPKELTKEQQQKFQFEYYKEHFFDNIDFSDKRMLRTPIFFSKMDTYLNKLTMQHPDSISKSADVLVNLSRSNKDIFQYVVSYITSTYERSKIMGMDAVFVHMVENYYMNGEADWIDAKQLKKIEERAEKIAPNLIGRPAPPFLNQIGMPFMKDENDIVRRMYDIESDYTLLMFYSPDCGHCKKEVPKVKKVLDSLKTPRFLSNHKVVDITAYAVQTEFDKEAWKDFIKKNELNDWINVTDIQKDPEGNPAASSNWRDEYDIYSTPVIYLLDKKKRILAKRISYDQIAKIISRIEDNIQK